MHRTDGQARRSLWLVLGVLCGVGMMRCPAAEVRPPRTRERAHVEVRKRPPPKKRARQRPTIKTTGEGLLPYGLKLGMTRKQVVAHFKKRTVGRFTCNKKELDAEAAQRNQGQTAPFKRSKVVPVDRIPARFAGLPISDATCHYTAKGGLVRVDLDVRDHESLCGRAADVSLGRKRFTRAKAALTRRFGNAPMRTRKNSLTWLVWRTKGIELKVSNSDDAFEYPEKNNNARVRVALTFRQMSLHYHRVAKKAGKKPSNRPRTRTRPTTAKLATPSPLLGLKLGLTPAAVQKLLKRPGFKLYGKCRPKKRCKRLTYTVKSLLDREADLSLRFGRKGLSRWKVFWKDISSRYDGRYIYQQIQRQVILPLKLKAARWFHGCVRCQREPDACYPIHWRRGKVEARIRLDTSNPGPCPKDNLSFVMERRRRPTKTFAKCVWPPQW